MPDFSSKRTDSLVGSESEVSQTNVREGVGIESVEVGSSEDSVDFGALHCAKSKLANMPVMLSFRIDFIFLLKSSFVG
jgi:hypothetical protein